MRRNKSRRSNPAVEPTDFRQNMLTMMICVIVMSVTITQSAIGADSVPIHSLVRLSDGAASTARVAELGIALDHATWDGDAVEFAASADEQAAMRRAGLSFTVQIADLTAYYAARAAAEGELWRDAGGDIAGDAGSGAEQTAAEDRGFNFGSMGGFYTFAEVVASSTRCGPITRISSRSGARSAPVSRDVTSGWRRSRTIRTWRRGSRRFS